MSTRSMIALMIALALSGPAAGTPAERAGVRIDTGTTASPPRVAVRVAELSPTVRAGARAACGIVTSPCGSAQEMIAGDTSTLTVRLDDVFGVTDTYSLTCEAVAPMSSCALSVSSIQVTANGWATATATYIAGPMNGTGQVRIRATPMTYYANGVSEGWRSILVSNGLNSVDVLPKAAKVMYGPYTTDTATFVVKNINDGRRSQYDLYAFCTGTAGTLCAVSPAFVQLGVGDSASARVVFQAGAQRSAGQVRLAATLRSNPSRSDEGWVNFDVPTMIARLSPDGADRGAAAGTTNSIVFTLANDAPVGGRYSVSYTCTGLPTCPVPSTVTAPAYGAVGVTASFLAGSLGDTGSIRAYAEFATDPATKDTARIRVVTGGMTINADSTHSGADLERSLCVSAGAGSRSAFECGDLRLAHALPAVISLNSARAPTLLYNSQHAHPTPVLSADVTLPAGRAIPALVRGTLVFGDTVVATGTWPGNEWTSGETRRVALSFDAISYPTGLYEYTFEIAAEDGAASYRTVAQGLVPIVNRARQGGWWIAGVEQIYFPARGGVFWVGGDGSTRYYRPAGTACKWAATALDSPDTLTSNCAGIYTRHASHGTKVRFDDLGRHTATVSPLGYQTSFTYGSSGSLDSIKLPPSSSALAYTLHYGVATGFLERIEAPRAGSARTVSLTSEAGPVFPWPGVPGGVQGPVVTSITDPDGRAVAFGYGTSPQNPGDYRLRRRTDKRGTTTTFVYDGGWRLRSSSLDMGVGRQAITRTFYALESKGLPGSGTPASLAVPSAYTTLVGPRTDVAVQTLLWLDRFGAPKIVRDAAGNETAVTRGDVRWPALVTSVRAPNGLVTSSTLDARGNVATVSVPREGGTAVTRYSWDPVWDFATRIVGPTGDSVMIGYDTLTGRRLWQRPGGQTRYEIRFRYGSPLGQLSSIVTPKASLPASNPVRDSVRYDALGNLVASVTPRGIETILERDAIGRIGRTLAPIGSSNQLYWPTENSPTTRGTRTTRTFYDAMDRDTLVETSGPATERLDEWAGQFIGLVVWPAQTLRVRKGYDEMGNILSVERSGISSSTVTGPLTTRFSFDTAGRTTSECAPDLQCDRYEHDAAGNVTAHVTRRGHRLEMRYDALDRITHRIMPAVQHTVLNGLPRYSGGMLILPADTAIFTYDNMGRLVSANNGDARISRTYLPTGELSSDTLRVRSYGDALFSRHEYGLEYTYDLAGRRRTMKHPQWLLGDATGALPATWLDRTAYEYNRFGAVSRILAPEGQSFRFLYDTELRQDSLVASNGVAETYAYDADSRRIRMQQQLPSGGYLSQNDFWYTEDGKIINVENGVEIYRTWYTGLGAAAWHDEQFRNGSRLVRTRTEYSGIDPLGNRTAQFNVVPDAYNLYRARTIRSFEFSNATGRLMSERFDDGSTVAVPSAAYTYDASGNTATSGRTTTASRCGQYEGYCLLYMHHQYEEYHNSYYDAANRLRVVDRRTQVDIGWPEAAGGFEEFRYDALGRRVLRRYRSDCINLAICGNPTGYYGFVERVVYDGDQILYEIRAPGGKYASGAAGADSMENDKVDTLPALDASAYSNLYGRVMYVHGLGIDQALSVARLGRIAINCSNQTVLLHPNWQGQYTRGTTREGGLKHCEAQTNGRGLLINYRGQEVSSWLYRAYPQNEFNMYWFGSFLSLKHNATGQTYMRNRYYDAHSGRFTQEDPIGLAGGMNVYGYANGDPINFSDPFGLCPEKAADGAICLDFWISARSAWGFRGDNRQSDPNAPANRSRAQIVISGQTAVRSVTGSCSMVHCRPPRGDNYTSVTQGSDGSYTVNFNLKDSAAPFGLAPDLDGSVTLTPDGKGGYTTSGNVSAYPSSDIFQRQNGQWVRIRPTHNETSPVDLFDWARRHKW